MLPEIWCTIDGWTDRQTSKWMDGHIEVGPPPNKKLLKWVNKEQNNFNVYNVAFKEKALGDRIILNLCTKNLNDLIYSS